MAPTQHVWLPGSSGPRDSSKVADNSNHHLVSSVLNDSFEKQVAYFVVTCVLAAVLCGVFGRRLSLLQCKIFERKNPPMLHLGMCGLGIWTMGMNMLLEFLSMNGSTNACIIGGISTVILIILNKSIVFVYFVETIHALRACMRCRNESCGWTTRWSNDYVWSALTIICFGGTMAAIIHASLDFGKGMLLNNTSCAIWYSMSVVDHLLIWHSSFHALLFFTLLGISICTMKNFPKLNDVTACQYKIRSIIIKIIPLRPGAIEEPVGSNIAVICPAYLVPLNQRSAGRCECSALKTMATLSLTIVPTIINLGVLVGLHGNEPSWLLYILCEFDCAVNVFIIYCCSKNPDREDISRGPQHQPSQQHMLISCARPKTGNGPTPSSSKNDLNGKPDHGPPSEQSVESLRTFVNCEGEKLITLLGPRVPGSFLRRDSETSTVRSGSVEQSRIGSSSGSGNSGKKPLSPKLSNGCSNLSPGGDFLNDTQNPSH